MSVCIALGRYSTIATVPKRYCHRAHTKCTGASMQCTCCNRDAFVYSSGIHTYRDAKGQLMKEVVQQWYEIN